ncbi:MAG: Ala-tRNA(Pro) deacylase [Chlamydiales bacterium]|jgi:Ala-tRNA(Pro) deacylase
MSDTTEKIKDFLCKMLVPYQLLQHKPTYTSEDAAQERGEDLSIGGKAILMKLDDDFSLFVLSASLQIDSKKVRKLTGAKSIRFATDEELYKATGLKSGAVPPFGRPVQPLDIYIDDSIMKNAEIAFNAGSLTTSMKIQTIHYMRVVDGPVVSFSKAQN